MTKSVWIETFTPLFLVSELIIVYHPVHDPNKELRITTHWKSIGSLSRHAIILPNDIAQGCMPCDNKPNIYTCVDINDTPSIKTVMQAQYGFAYHRLHRKFRPRAEQPPAVDGRNAKRVLQRVLDELW